MEEFFLMAYLLFWGCVAIAGGLVLVYLVRQRLKARKQETFEQREN